MNPKQRPAEWGAVAGAIALLAGRAAGIDDADTITALAIVIGFIPTLITSIVELARRDQARPESTR